MVLLRIPFVAAYFRKGWDIVVGGIAMEPTRRKEVRTWQFCRADWIQYGEMLIQVTPAITVPLYRPVHLDTRLGMVVGTELSIILTASLLPIANIPIVNPYLIDYIRSSREAEHFFHFKSKRNRF